MLLWICIAIFVIGIIMSIVYDNTHWCDHLDIRVWFIVIGSVAMLISGIVLGVNYIGKDAYIDIMNERYDILTYQYDNNIYDNDNDLGKRELMVDIQSWNEDLAARRVLQHNFWVGPYVPDIYDQFEFVELE